ncbi:MAG: serine/threonine protein kinase [Alphaproteobacteria bacterium]|nr:serine/threonine protein kinase [Alphaproteobacteria bacterium]
MNPPDDSAPPTDRIPLDADALETIRNVAPPSEPPRPLTGPPLVLGEEIGRGGMGVVRAARQQSLKRQVAAKTVTGGGTNEELLQEAWVAGALEHPNIVPVYDIEVVDDQPWVVMKRIQGVPWSTLIGSRRRIRERFGTDPLEWNLQTLLSVCNAVEYAHSRGVLHRDLKPSNVMIGDYGEVWVVDWGAAVSVLDTEDSRFPLARDQDQFTGTPAYMAPEMLLGDGRALTEKTDIYLLGGLLWKIVTGRPPHPGDVHEIVRTLLDPLEIPDSLPFADLLRRTLDPMPPARPASVAEFRLAVTDFLAHRGSTALVASARRHLERLADLTSIAEPEDPHAHRLQIYDVYGACRFGFGEALAAWADSTEAREGLRDAVERLVSYELAQGDPRSALLHLGQLESPPADLVQRAEALAARRRDDLDELDRLRSDSDPETAWQARWLVFAVGGLFTFSIPVGLLFLDPPQGYVREVVVAVFSAGMTLVLVGMAGPWLLRSRVNRGMLALVLMAPPLAILVHLGCWLAGLPARMSGALELLPYTVLLTVGTALVDWRLFPSNLIYIASFLLAMSDPDRVLLFMGVANLSIALNAVVIWGPWRWARGTSGAEGRG